MPEPANHPKVEADPLEQGQRIQIIDAIRGVALLGILLMNIPFFGQPYQYNFNLNLRNEFSGPNYYTWWVVGFFFEGTMRGLFSMLFGAGSLLLLSRLEKKPEHVTPADIYYRRMLWLLAFGMVNAFIFLWPGDILYSYAIAGLFLFPFRRMKARTLLIIGIVIISISTLISTIQMHGARSTRIKGEKAIQLQQQKEKLSEEQEGDLKKWEGMKERMDPQKVKAAANKEITAMRKGYFDVMQHLAGINVKLQSIKYYASTFWDVIGFFFLGMALFKWGVITGQRSNRFYLILMLIGYGIGLFIRYHYLSTVIKLRFDITRVADYSPVNLYQIHRALVALGHLSLLTLLYKAHLMKGFFKRMSNVGQMAFSNYLMQSIICTLFFNGYGLRWFGALQRYQLYYVVVSVWVFQIIFSAIWLHYFKFGPFEWAWRSLTYWKKQPLKRIVTEEKLPDENITLAPTPLVGS